MSTRKFLSVAANKHFDKLQLFSYAQLIVDHYQKSLFCLIILHCCQLVFLLIKWLFATRHRFNPLRIFLLYTAQNVNSKNVAANTFCSAVKFSDLRCLFFLSDEKILKHFFFQKKNFHKFSLLLVLNELKKSSMSKEILISEVNALSQTVTLLFYRTCSSEKNINSVKNIFISGVVFSLNLDSRGFSQFA